MYDEMQDLMADNPVAAQAKSIEEARRIVEMKEGTLDMSAPSLPLSAEVESCTKLHWTQVSPSRYVIPLGHSMFSAEVEVFLAKEKR